MSEDGRVRVYLELIPGQDDDLIALVERWKQEGPFGAVSHNMRAALRAYEEGDKKEGEANSERQPVEGFDLDAVRDMITDAVADAITRCGGIQNEPGDGQVSHPESDVIKSALDALGDDAFG
jgi:Arc/MetJ-type ribon-helix-helix transcriptional regulator